MPHRYYAELWNASSGGRALNHSKKIGSVQAREDGIVWRHLFPWGGSWRRLTVPWAEVEQVEVHAGVSVWSPALVLQLLVARSEAFKQDLERYGFTLHERATWPGRVVATMPGREPDWTPDHERLGDLRS